MDNKPFFLHHGKRLIFFRIKEAMNNGVFVLDAMIGIG
jgi:hypothetical protein